MKVDEKNNEEKFGNSEPLLEEKVKESNNLNSMFDPNSEPPQTSQMLSCFLKIAVPAIVTNVIGFAVVVNNLIFAGSLNDPVKLAV